jgi:hypothetical protein
MGDGVHVLLLGTVGDSVIPAQAGIQQEKNSAKRTTKKCRPAMREIIRLSGFRPAPE